MREVKFTSVDFDLFDQDITPLDFEFFKKHTGAFKRLLEDQSKDQKLNFIQAFQVFSIKHGCIKKLGKIVGTPRNGMYGGDVAMWATRLACRRVDVSAVMGENSTMHVNEAITYYTDNFANGKLSTAKMLVMDAVCLAQNRPMLQHLGTQSYAKDPFCHKDTRDTFRRLFGNPSEQNSCMKVLCALPMHLKFGGSLCRYLRRWLDAEEIPEDGKMPSDMISTTTTIESTTSNSKTTEASPDKSQTSTQDQQSSAAQKKSTTAAKAETTTKTKKAPAEETTSPTDSNGSRAAKQSDQRMDKRAPKKKKNYIPLGIIHVNGASKTTSFSTLLDTSKDDNLWGNTVLNKLHELKAEEEEDDSSSCMDVYKVELDGSLKKLREDFHLGKPHPNEIFDNLCKEKEEKTRKAAAAAAAVAVAAENGKAKKHSCANCRMVEVTPKSYKKCQLCKGKRTRFYCSRECQAEDWTSRHRQDHETEAESVK